MTASPRHIFAMKAIAARISFLVFSCCSGTETELAFLGRPINVIRYSGRAEASATAASVVSANTAGQIVSITGLLGEDGVENAWK
jgi:hypothetical protein